MTSGLNNLLIGKHACGNICAKLYDVASCKFCNTVKVKCAVSGANIYLFIHNKLMRIWQCFICLVVVRIMAVRK